jgi:GNAT superfamily N-acetyltransferase
VTATIDIRNATEWDVPLVLDLIRQLAEYEHLSDRVAANEQNLRDTLFREPPAAEVLLASLQEESVGFAVFFTNYSTFLAKPGIYLEDLFVKPHARGKGIGKALLARLARLAIERGCGRIEWSVLDWNKPSIRFYESLGAVALNEWTTFRLTGAALDKLGSDSE